MIKKEHIIHKVNIKTYNNNNNKACTMADPVEMYVYSVYWCLPHILIGFRKRTTSVVPYEN